MGVTRRTIILPVALAAALLAPAAAQAKPCPKLVGTVDEPEAIVDYNQAHPDGAAPSGGKLRYPGHFFDATEDIVVKVQRQPLRGSTRGRPSSSPATARRAPTGI